MKTSVLLGTVIGILSSSSAIFAQNQVSGTVSPDLSTRRIITISELQPPKEVLESGLGGNVRVKISIDEGGNVTSADEVVGPGSVCRQVSRADVVAMRNAAKGAAMTAKFEPGAESSDSWLNFSFPGTEEVASTSGHESDGTKYTVQPDVNYSASSTPPPDYSGPVTTGGSETKPVLRPNVPRTLTGGVLNGKAVDLPKPSYPPAARAVRASGSVGIQVLIDEKGQVFLAKAVSGHPLLRHASAMAACEARFAPTQLEGVPIKVAGIITYNFVP